MLQVIDGKTLDRWRTERNIGVLELARKASMDPAQVSRILAGKHQYTTPVVIERLCAALGISRDDVEV